METQGVMTRKLTPLSRLSGAAAPERPDRPDLRGWALVDGAGAPFGEVADLLVDEETGEARLLDVALDPSLCSAGAGSVPPEPLEREPEPGWTGISMNAGLAGAASPVGLPSVLFGSPPSHRSEERPPTHPATRHVLLPLADSRLDREHRRLVFSWLRAAQAASLPTYEPGRSLEVDARDLAGDPGARER
jgi:hypothetical protein